MRLEEAFPVLVHTLQRGSGFHKEVAQRPLEEIFVLLGRRRDFESEDEQRVQRQRVSVSQTATDETMRGDTF